MKSNIIKFVILNVLLFLTYSCNSSEKIHKNGNNIEVLNTQNFQKKMNDVGEFQLIDVRTPEEYNSGHLKNAININYYDNNFATELKKLDKDKPTFVYCRSGSRSGKATSILKEAGFNEIYDMQGGITAWNADGFAIETGSNNMNGISISDYNGIINSEKLVLIDFNAKWCEPCKVLSPILDKISKDYPQKLELVKIDIDKNPKIAKELNINAIPALKLYKNGKVVWNNLGLLNEETIRTVIKQYL